MNGLALDRRTILVDTGLFVAMGVSVKSLAMDMSLPMKAADIDPAFQKHHSQNRPRLPPSSGSI